MTDNIDNSQRSTIFSAGTWERDRALRYDIKSLTQAFHRSVPSLEYLNWTIEEIGRGYAVTRLPLNVESSNQYITQQAALMLLAADYTGGIALSTLFEGTPIIGFHPQRTDYGAYLWGATATIKWLRPSTSDLILKSTIPERDWDRIATAFNNGEEVRYKARIKLYNERKLAAVSDFEYWARSSRSLRATGASLITTHHMLLHKLRTSARLIAGLRSWINTDEHKPLDPYAAHAAGPQGQAMAKKFSRDTPQLADLVRARTISCDDALLAFSKLHERFLVINIGCGYDSRPWRLADLGGASFLMLDLPAMLADRQVVMPLPETSKYSVIFREYDLLVQKLGEILRDARVPENLPKFFIWEGCSMYFSKADSDTYLEELRENMNEQSKLWFDFVATVAVTDDTGYQEVTAFMESMRLIGEPFVNGFESVENDLNRLGFNLTSCCSAADVTRSHDPLQTYYSFVLCTRRL